MEYFHKYIENDNNLSNKKNFYLIFQINIQQTQQTQKKLTQNISTIRSV